MPNDPYLLRVFKGAEPERSLTLLKKRKTEFPSSLLPESVVLATGKFYFQVRPFGISPYFRVRFADLSRKREITVSVSYEDSSV